MRIIEQFIKGKASDEALCEDILLVTDDFIAIIDGVTAKGCRLFNGKSGGRATAEAVCEAIKLFPKDISVLDAVCRITEKVSSLYESNEEKGCAAAGAIIFSIARKEIWNVGDCQCIINNTKHLHEKEVDRIYSQKRAEILENAIKNGATQEELLINDIGREAILPQLKTQHQYANKECNLGYAVFNGTPIPESMITTYKLSEGDTLVLASDGYPVLCDTLGESEELLQRELTENPLCYKGYKSTKGLQPQNSSFDDRTYIKIQL